MHSSAPRLRFHDFTDNWRLTRLGELLDSISSGKSSTTTDGNVYPIYGSTGRIGKSDSYDYSGDKLLIARVGANAGSMYRVSGSYKVSDNTLIVNLKDNIDTTFVQYSLVNFNINRLIFGSGQPLVTGGMLKNAKLAFPSKPEQEKIADFLAAIDERIALNEQKLQLLQRYRREVMQEIFSRQIRVKDGDGNSYPGWEQMRLGDIGTTYNGLTGKSGDDFGVGSDFITYMQIFSNSKVNQNFGKVSIAPSEKQNKVQYGDIFFTTSSETPRETGYASVLLDNPANTYLNSFCFGFRADQNTLSPKFARYLFHSSKVRRSIVRLAQGSTRYNISKVEMMQMNVALPSIEEQIKIADLMTTIDEKITAEESKVTASRQFKKALLQRMFA